MNKAQHHISLAQGPKILVIPQYAQPKSLQLEKLMIQYALESCNPKLSTEHLFLLMSQPPAAAQFLKSYTQAEFFHTGLPILSDFMALLTQSKPASLFLAHEQTISQSHHDFLREISVDLGLIYRHRLESFFQFLVNIQPPALLQAKDVLILTSGQGPFQLWSAPIHKSMTQIDRRFDLLKKILERPISAQRAHLAKPLLNSDGVALFAVHLAPLMEPSYGISWHFFEKFLEKNPAYFAQYLVELLHDYVQFDCVKSVGISFPSALLSALIWHELKATSKSLIFFSEHSAATPAAHLLKFLTMNKLETQSVFLAIDSMNHLHIIEVSRDK